MILFTKGVKNTSYEVALLQEKKKSEQREGLPPALDHGKIGFDTSTVERGRTPTG